jgi:hypothetical protein
MVLGPHTVPTATTRFGNDDMLLFLLTCTWELYTGRPAPAVPLTNMTEEELIEYWSHPFDDPALFPEPATSEPGPAEKDPSA